MRLEPATTGFTRGAAPSIRAFGIGVLILVLWTLWQCVAVEAMRLPWEDEILYTLPSVNWATGGPFALPQLGHFMEADSGWRWHMPLFPMLAAIWVKAFGCQLPVLRLFSLLPATFMAFLLARCCVRLAGQRDWPWLLFWLGIILGDKSIVMNSLSGRMEFWCLLAVIGSLTLALNWRNSSGAVWAGVLLGLVSGAMEGAARTKLIPADLNRFFIFGAYGSDSPDRTELTSIAIEKAIRLHAGLTPSEVFVVGDTPRDIEAAKAAGAVSVGVATGNYSVAQLADAGGDHVIESLEKPFPGL